jgi:hypothetical protein
MNDPTYDLQKINAHPVWKLAFELSEVDNDNAPIGWWKYFSIADHLVRKYELKEKNANQLI